MTRIARLRERYPLGAGWSEPTLVADTIEVAGVVLRRAGVAATSPDGREATGSAAERRRSPVLRAYCELLERASIVDALATSADVEVTTADGAPAGRCAVTSLFSMSDAPERFRYALSNGVAIHHHAREARLRALWETVERDRVLRSWYGLVTPESATLPRAVHAAAGYEWRACAFPPSPIRRWDAGIHAAAIVGFPLDPSLPLARGFAARSDRARALGAAAREALQGLAFLWGEPLPHADPEVAPNPTYHLDKFLFAANQPLLRAWLDGANARFGSASQRARDGDAPVRFADLTPPALRGKLYVVKAICPDAAPLAFGDDPAAAHLPAPLRAHPVA